MFYFYFEGCLYYRNPRDVCQSRFNYLQSIEKYTGDLQTIVNIMTKDLGDNNGPYFKHILSYWNKRKEASDNLLVVFYEDMQQDLGTVIRKVANFLGVSLAEDRIEPMVKHLSFESMKKNPSTVLTTELQVRFKIIISIY